MAAQLAKAAIAAERGDLGVTEALTREAEALILPMGATPMLALVQFVRGRQAVAHQHYAEGFEHLRRTLDPADTAYHPFIGAWGLSDLIEAAAHSVDGWPWNGSWTESPVQSVQSGPSVAGLRGIGAGSAY